MVRTATLHVQHSQYPPGRRSSQLPEALLLRQGYDFAAWPRWLATAKTTLLSRFTTHLARDQDAVLASLTLPWSNGPVEAQVHQLKLIKRSMHGRANFNLLRLRVLQPA